MPDKPVRKLTELDEKDLTRIVDERITKALGLAPQDLEGLPQDTPLMATPSVLSTVRATATAMC